MREGKVTLTCGHINEPSVGIWEPETDRHGNRCRSYSTYCPACAEEATRVMVGRIEELETKLAKAVEALDKLDVGEGWAAQIARATLAELKGEEG